MSQDFYDLIILGAGSTGFAAALRAHELGKTSIIIEERATGGTCVNRGLPSKNLIEAAKLIHDAQDPRYPGLTPTQIRVNFRKLIEQKDQLIHSYRQKKHETLGGGRFTIKKGHVQFIDDHSVQVDGKRITGEKLLIATGSRPIVPHIEGLQYVPYLTSELLTADEPIELRELPSSLIIFGGGYIALELGQMFSRFGSKVTVLERSRQLLAHGYEPEVSQAIEEVFRAEGIRVIGSVTVRSVYKEEMHVTANIETEGKPHVLRAENLLLATGRRPNTDNIGIEKTGVKLGQEAQILVDEFLRTSVPHIFAAGDVIGHELGNQLATPVGSQDGGIAAENAFTDGPLRRIDHRVVPRSIFTDPQIATVGLTEEEAISAGYNCWRNSVAISLVPRAIANRNPLGIVKMVADANTDEVIGVSMVGDSAGEVIHEAAMGLRFRAKVSDFIEQLHVCPTMAEALKIVAISRRKDPSKLSCCAE